MPGRIAATFRVGSARQRGPNKRPVRAFGKCGGGTTVKRQVPGTQFLGSCWLHSGTQCDLLPEREMHSPSTGKGSTAFPGINEPLRTGSAWAPPWSPRPLSSWTAGQVSPHGPWRHPSAGRGSEREGLEAGPLSGPPLGALTCLFSPAPP